MARSIISNSENGNQVFFNEVVENGSEVVIDMNSLDKNKAISTPSFTVDGASNVIYGIRNLVFKFSLFVHFGCYQSKR